MNVSVFAGFFLCLFQGWDRSTRANPSPPPIAWRTCLYLQIFFHCLFLSLFQGWVRDTKAIPVPLLSILSKRIDMKGLNIYIYQRHNKTSISQRFGIYIFTVFTTKLKSPIPQNCWDIRINGIYKSKIWKESKRIDMNELNSWDIRINRIYKSKIWKESKRIDIC